MTTRWALDLRRWNVEIIKISGLVDKQAGKLRAVDVDYLVYLSLSLANHASELADTLRKHARVSS
jgi:hypothetical protein